MFLKFVLKHQGGSQGRTLGPCDHISGHASGRAWDWMIRADVTEERAKADELIDWLLANNAEIFRRAGLAYIIWDKQIYSALDPRWKPYDGFDEAGDCIRPPCRSPHTDHVHFSFNIPGADGKTSFYRWLGADMPEVVPPPPTPLAKQSANHAPLFIAFAVGLAGAIYLPRTKLWKSTHARAASR